MNERIEDIARQCMSMKFFVDTASEEFDYNKFAELMFKECAKVINADIELQIKDGIISNVHGLNQARNLIKEHFGFENI